MAVLKYKPKRKADAPKPVAPPAVDEPAADAQPATPAAAPASDDAVAVEPVAGPSGLAPGEATADDETEAVAEDPEELERKQLEEMKYLRRILEYVEGAQTANTNYSITLGAALSTISHAKTRFDELAVRAMLKALADAAELHRGARRRSRARSVARHRGAGHGRGRPSLASPLPRPGQTVALKQ